MSAIRTAVGRSRTKKQNITRESGAYTTAERAALRRITPVSNFPAGINEATKRLECALKKQQIRATVIVGGSIAKGTFLRGDHDVDVFVRFSTTYDDATLSGLLETAIKDAFPAHERVHGSRDYFHVQHAGFTFEFVPVLDINTWAEARNVTDMSPLHVAYVRDKIAQRPQLAKDIRLTKQFCKAAKVYGAESYISGFSGHVIDLLVIHYGGFRGLLAAAAAWPAKTVLDPEQRLDNPLTQLNNAKTQAPLVIVDPVQQDRNSAAAVSKEAYDALRAAARSYNAAPAKEQHRFFTVLPLDIDAFTKEHRDERVLIIRMKPQSGKKDVVGAKCLKVVEHLHAELLRHDFRIIATTWEFTPAEAIVLFALPREPLPAQQEIIGPPVHKTADAARFRAAHTTVYTKNNRLHAIDARADRLPEQLTQRLLQGRYVTGRVQQTRLSVRQK